VKKLSIEEKISALYLCADVLDYPDKTYIKKLDDLKLLLNNSFEEFDLEYIESEYISIFSMSATKLKCVPYASWWLDGKMSGLSTSKIKNFYKKCGYTFDETLVEKPVDHISLMLVFVAILLEEKKFKEINEFIKFLSWLNDFANSLNKASDIKYFYYAIDTAQQIINSLKEEV
jgi:TorA maturation chaperone TorD